LETNQKKEMHMIKKLLVGLLGVMLSSSIAFATPIKGSASIGAVSATLVGGSNLLTATSVSANEEFIGAGLHDYAPIVNMTPITDTTLDLSNILAYTWTSPVGTWTTSAYTILTHTTHNLDIFLTGLFTPAGVLAGYEASAASERLSLNQSGESASWAGTLNSPPLGNPTPVPEPGTMMLLGSGLFGLIVYSKRRKNQDDSCAA
jgi:hypothetical protein